MNLIKAIIVDDERQSHDILKWKLENIGANVHIEECFYEPQKALKFLKQNSVDLVFLDIDMPKMNGFQLLEKLNKIDFSVIFTTAYDEYALRAIKLSALDYLLKPIDVKELKIAIDKFVFSNNKSIRPIQFEEFFANQKRENKSKRITLSTRESIEFVEVSNIICCASDSNYTKVKLVDGTERLLSKTLKEFDELLVNYGFFRSHNSHLVNINHVKEIKRRDGGFLLLTNGIEVPITKARKSALLNLI